MLIFADALSMPTHVIRHAASPAIPAHASSHEFYAAHQCYWYLFFDNTAITLFSVDIVFADAIAFLPICDTPLLMPRWLFSFAFFAFAIFFLPAMLMPLSFIAAIAAADYAMLFAFSIFSPLRFSAIITLLTFTLFYADIITLTFIVAWCFSLAFRDRIRPLYTTLIFFFFSLVVIIDIAFFRCITEYHRGVFFFFHYHFTNTRHHNVFPPYHTTTSLHALYHYTRYRTVTRHYRMFANTTHQQNGLPRPSQFRHFRLLARRFRRPSLIRFRH